MLRKNGGAGLGIIAKTLSNLISSTYLISMGVGGCHSFKVADGICKGKFHCYGAIQVMFGEDYFVI